MFLVLGLAAAGVIALVAAADRRMRRAVWHARSGRPSCLGSCCCSPPRSPAWDAAWRGWPLKPQRPCRDSAAGRGPCTEPAMLRPLPRPAPHRTPDRSRRRCARRARPAEASEVCGSRLGTGSARRGPGGSRRRRRALAGRDLGWRGRGRLLLDGRHAACCGPCSAVQCRPGCDPGVMVRVAALAARLGIRPPVRVLTSLRLDSPVVFGSVRPVLVLPRHFQDDFNPRQQEAILAHELAHLAACDPAWQSLAMAACGLLWWHPWRGGCGGGSAKRARPRPTRRACSCPTALAAWPNRWSSWGGGWRAPFLGLGRGRGRRFSVGPGAARRAACLVSIVAAGRHRAGAPRPGGAALCRS